MQEVEAYRPKKPLRFVTASSLFDGHDASINIMRRILQASGAEVIHLGHNRSAKEVVYAAIQEDADAISVSSYQGGHMEYFRYMKDLLDENKASHIQLFGGGGGTIIPREVKALQAYGIAKIFTPEDGRGMGLQGMINHMLRVTEENQLANEEMKADTNKIKQGDRQAIARAITFLEQSTVDSEKQSFLQTLSTDSRGQIPVLGITGTGGAGKSSLTDELIRRFLSSYPDQHIALVSIDPTKRKTKGALLGDRIRMNAIFSDRVYMRSLATRESKTEVSLAMEDVLTLLKNAAFDMILVETSGIGQGDAEITRYTDMSMYVMTAEFGAPTQLEKIDMIDFADFIAINKFEQQGSADALKQVRKQYERAHLLFHQDQKSYPVYGTIASQFNDPGVQQLFRAIMKKVSAVFDWEKPRVPFPELLWKEKQPIIPNDSIHYLREISETIQTYHEVTDKESDRARKLYQLTGTKEMLKDEVLQHSIEEKIVAYREEMDSKLIALLDTFEKTKEAYSQDTLCFQVRDKSIEMELTTTSLSGLSIPKVMLPNYHDWGDQLTWLRKENIPGSLVLHPKS